MGSARLEPVSILLGVLQGSPRCSRRLDGGVVNSTGFVGEVEESLVSDVPLSSERDEYVQMVSSVAVELVCCDPVVLSEL